MLLYQSTELLIVIQFQRHRKLTASTDFVIIDCKRSCNHLSPEDTEHLFSPCRRRITSIRCYSVASSTKLAVLATPSLMLLLRAQRTSNPLLPSLLLLMILLSLTSRVSCLSGKVTNSATSSTTTAAAAAAVVNQDESPLSLDLEEDAIDVQASDFCYDSEGERHGLFSTWQDFSTGCQCSCQSVGNVVVSLCDDNCDASPAKSIRDSLPSQNDEPFSSLVYSGIPKSPSSSKHTASKLPVSSCQDKNSGNRYLDGQSWMSSSRACAKCYCINGTADCENSVLHCQSSCQPGQKLVSTGPCCEHRCIGEPIVSSSKGATGLTAGCTEPEAEHGTVVIRQQQCVDQHCQCINGNWFCIDTCIPLEELKCPPEERIFWDAFCCPRCKGTKQCNVTVATINWLDEAPVRKGLPRFVSIFTSEGEKEVLRGPSHSSKTQTEFGAAGNGADTALEKTSLITVDPGQHLVTHTGRCICTDGELRCSRPGSGVWHDTDCYYSHGDGGSAGGGRYYARGEHWKAYNDECSECQCLEDRRYTCARTPCSALFLCPPGRVPVAAPGDCCPSACEDAVIARANERIDQPLLEPVEEDPQWDPDSDAPLPSVLSTGGRCKPLGDLYVASAPETVDGPGAGGNSAGSNIFLPSESLVIIRRTCVSLKCVCSSDGNWVCADYCIPCDGVAILAKNAVGETEILNPVRPSTADGCCPKCSELDSKEGAGYLGDRYSVTFTCFLALVALTPLLVIISCCICLRYRRRLKKLRSTETHPTKYHLECGTAVMPLPKSQSVQSSLAMPLTISTNAECSSSPPIALHPVPPTCGPRDSIHQSLLFNTKLDEVLPVSDPKCWRLSASYSCLPTTQAAQHPNPTFVDTASTPRKSPLSASSCEVNTLSSKRPLKVIQSNPAKGSPMASSSSSFPSSPQLERIETMVLTHEGSKKNWKSRLRRSSTQPRTHFFPHAWKAMFSKSAAGVETTPSKQILPPRECLLKEKTQRAVSVGLEAPSHVIHARNSASLDLTVISETV